MKKASAQQQGPIAISRHIHTQIKLLINTGININIIGKLYWQNSPSLCFFLRLFKLDDAPPEFWHVNLLQRCQRRRPSTIKNAGKRMWPPSKGSAEWPQIHTHKEDPQPMTCVAVIAVGWQWPSLWPTVSDEEWNRSPICLSLSSQQPVAAHTTPDLRVSGPLARKR